MYALFPLLLSFIFCCFSQDGFALAGPLSTDGNQIVDQEKKAVRIQGISWFGFESEQFAPQGLDIRSYRSMLDQMKSLGFNTIRIPYSNQMLDEGSIPIGIDFDKNPDLEGLTPLEILDQIVAYAGEIELAIILDHHRSEAGIGASKNGLWYTEDYPEERFVEDWSMLAERYRESPAIIGADLHNEPHEVAAWAEGDESTDWKSAAEKVGNVVLNIAPHWLIIVEGIQFYGGEEYWWGSHLGGVKNAPIILEIPNQLVFSPHDYPKSVHEKPWHHSDQYPDNLPEHFSKGWGYLFETGAFPVILGEFGSQFSEEDDYTWMSMITQYLNGGIAVDSDPDDKEDKQGISWIWWAWNPNQGESGGILLDDWHTVDESKLQWLEAIKTYSESPADPRE